MSNAPVYCKVCAGHCRLELGSGAGDAFKVWAEAEQKSLRKFTLPEWYHLLSRHFHITGVRLA